MDKSRYSVDPFQVIMLYLATPISSGYNANNNNSLLFYVCLKLQQLLIFLSTISKGTMQERLRWIFRLYDTDGDGVIQPSELFTLIWALREMAGVSSDKTHIDSKKAATESLVTPQYSAAVKWHDNIHVKSLSYKLPCCVTTDTCSSKYSVFFLDR